MKALTDYIHAKGLKAGIYTSPGPSTCGGFAGSWRHEAQDARQFADWGFDFLKYDWCSYGSVAGGNTTWRHCRSPIRLMGELLKQQNRDMVLQPLPVRHGQRVEVGRRGRRPMLADGRRPGLRARTASSRSALKNAEHRRVRRSPALERSRLHPDRLHRRCRRQGPGREPCPLTPDEQYAFMSLWCLMASPLFYSGDMAARRLHPERALQSPR